MHKQGEKLERRKVALDAEGFERTGASMIVNWIWGFVACVCLTHACASEHICAQACVTACVHVQFRVHMRVLLSTCARKHV